MTWHPDRHQGSAEERSRAEEKFKSLQEAYRVLGNAELRRLYNAGQPIEL